MIRPIDLQTTLFSVQSGPTLQRAEEGVRIDAQTAQAAFAAEATHRDERVAPTTEVLPNKVGQKQHGSEQRRERRQPHGTRTPFEQVVDDVAASSEDAAHIVDYTA
jgi:hypothetical protein